MMVQSEFSLDARFKIYRFFIMNFFFMRVMSLICLQLHACINRSMIEIWPKTRPTWEQKINTLPSRTRRTRRTSSAPCASGVLVMCSPTAQKPLSHAEKNGIEKEHNKKGQKFESLIQNCLLKTQRIRTRFHP